MSKLHHSDISTVICVASEKEPKFMDARKIPFRVWILTLTGSAATRHLSVEPNLSSHPSALSTGLSSQIMPASISTRLDEQEFLEMADIYYVNPRREMTDNPSRTGSTTTISTNNVHLRRRDTTPGPRWRPSTLKECDDSGPASCGVDESHRYDILEGQTFSHIVIDPRGLLKTPTSLSLESYSDDTQTFRTEKGPDLGKPTVGSLNTLPPQIQLPQIDPVLRSSSSLHMKISRPISTASLASGSCFGIICFPWNMKGSGRSGFRLRRQRKIQVAETIDLGTGSRPDNLFSLIPLDSSQSGEEYLMSLPSQGFSSTSSPLAGLDYDYHLAVEVLINGSDVEPKPIS